MKVVVIGGVAGGPSFATRLRRLNEEHEIVIYERGENISYASCALPYYLGGVIEDLDSLIERTPEILKVKIISMSSRLTRYRQLIQIRNNWSLRI